MNAGQFNAILDNLREMNGQLDEMRRAVNRIDNRLKDMPDDRAATVVRSEIKKVLDGVNSRG